jgi:hypothetical protein
MRLRTTRGSCSPRVVAGDRLVGLVHPAVPEERLVEPAVLRSHDEHQQSGGDAVQSVRGTERGQVELAPQPHQRGLHDVPAPGDGGQEVRLVHDDQALVPVHDVDLERHRDLVGQIAMEPEERVRYERGVRGDGALGPDYPALDQHRVDPSRVDPRQPVDQVVAHAGPRHGRRGAQPDRVEPVPLRQRGRPPAAAQIDLRIASMMAAVRSGGSMCAHSRSMTSA